MNRLTLSLLVLTLYGFMTTISAQTAPVVLWENGAPNALGKSPEDVPTLTPFLAAKEVASGATIIVLPGGGYSHLSETKEGTDVAKWLNSLGISAFVLKYRLGMKYHEPNQLLDAARAMRTVRARAKEWNLDANRIGILGFSAGGHLALMMGMLPDGTSLDNNCYGDEKLNVAAIINWYGISDVNDLIQGANLKNYAVMWMGSQPNAAEISKRVSPLTYVRKNLPPILTIHGDKDDVVPYSQATRLKDALDKAKVTNELFTVKNGGHGGFTQTDYVNAYNEIWKFLKDNKITQ